MKRVFAVLILVIVSLVLAAPAFCFDGKISKIEETAVTVEVVGELPPWVKKDALASTSSGLAKVTKVDGKVIELKVRSSTAEALKVGEVLNIKPKDANPSQMLQGC
jgi:hypothetical protein